MKVLEIRPEQTIIQDDDGEVVCRPTGEYYKIRLFDYDNRRINYIFNVGMYVFETFDQRIFNAWCNGMRLQLRQDLSDQLIAAINIHKETGVSEAFVTLFEFAAKEIPFYNILYTYFKNFENVVKTNFGYTVDGEFLIDYKGNAWVKRPKALMNYEDKEINKHWQSLCIVMQGHRYDTDDAWIPDGVGNIVKVNALTMTIITKVMFLINPNLQDGIFTNQLPNKLLEKLKMNGGEIIK